MLTNKCPRRPLAPLAQTAAKAAPGILEESTITVGQMSCALQVFHSPLRVLADDFCPRPLGPRFWVHGLYAYWRKLYVSYESAGGQPIQQRMKDTRKWEFVTAVWAAGLVTCAVSDFNRAIACAGFPAEVSRLGDETLTNQHLRRRVRRLRASSLVATSRPIRLDVTKHNCHGISRL